MRGVEVLERRVCVGKSGQLERLMESRLPEIREFMPPGCRLSRWNMMCKCCFRFA